MVERYNLVNDTWSGVRAGITGTPEYLAMIKQFAGETDPNVWAILNGSLRTLDSILTGDARATMRQEIRDIAGPALNRLGFAGKADETSQDRELRASLMSLLGTIGEDAACRKQAETLFASWKKDKTSIDSNLLPATVSILAYTGDKARYEEFFNLFKTAKTPQEEQRFLGSLTAFRDKELLDRSIKLMMSEHVRTQDAPYIFAALLRNDVCGETAWDYMREHWGEMVKAFPENGVVRMIGGVESLDRRTGSRSAQVLREASGQAGRDGHGADARTAQRQRAAPSDRVSEADEPPGSGCSAKEDPSASDKKEVGANKK